MKKKIKNRVDIYEKTTQRIIEMLEEGVPPWRKTWGQKGSAQNYETGHVYTGINWFLLNLVAPYTQPYYLTWSQVKKIDGTVKKGSKAEYVYFYKKYYKDENGNNISDQKAQEAMEQGKSVEPIAFLKSHKVFNVECIEWNFPDQVYSDNIEIDECEVLIQSMSEVPKFITEDPCRAFYRLRDDSINLPPIYFFESPQEFYNVAFHEIIHWTGSTSRLGRKGFVIGEKPTEKEYGEEELIAELGAVYLCGYTGIKRTEILKNNAAYLDAWVKRLKGDSKLIFRAAPKAQEAANFVIGKKHERNVEVLISQNCGES